MSSTENGSGKPLRLARDRHINFFKLLLKCLPRPYISLQCSRIMALYFCCSGLDILGALEDLKDKQDLIEWIYAQQCEEGGFIGGGFTPRSKEESCENYRQGHVTMTYTALATLAVLGDDFSRVNRAQTLQWLSTLQNEDGSFQAVRAGSETDVRFVFSAAAVCFMLQDYSGINIPKAQQFLLSVQSHDGGIGMLPGQESHGGPSYCVCAALRLLGTLEEYPGKESLLKFLVYRQVGGFNGRINKKPDSCYTFWVGGALEVLGMDQFIDREEARKFLYLCENAQIGGFSKVPGIHPDILHTYMSISAMSIIDEEGTRPIVSALGITQRAFKASPFAESTPPDGTKLLA